MGITKNMTELIGKTPLVQLNRICEGSKAKMAAKLEFFNPASTGFKLTTTGDHLMTR